MNHTTSRAVNECPLYAPVSGVSGAPVPTPDGECYEIRDYDRMKPFLMTIAGSSDHWMYLSSTGGLTCGRRSPDQALFPYYTDDKIHDAAHTTGPLTVLRVVESAGDGGDVVQRLWLPFSDRYNGLYRVSRRLLKRLAGDMVVFEEWNETLGLVFRYGWRFSPAFGFLRECRLENVGTAARRVEILDGVRNLLPAGVDRSTQERASTLVDAYKLSELVPGSDLAVYSMSSLITDRAEPSEALSASVAWHAGLPEPTILLSEEQVAAFAEGASPTRETAIRGRRGAYLAVSAVDLPRGAHHDWTIVADTARDSASVADLDWTLSRMRDAAGRLRLVQDDAIAGEHGLVELVARADGLQYTGDTMVRARHYSNVLFNIMRGGIPVDGYTVDREDFRAFLHSRNRVTAAAHRELLSALPDAVSYGDLREAVERSGDPQLERLTLEYLPLTFSRRHGDPSRPWNRFSIDVEYADGRPRLSWQGNWRDIFQNWEALARSYPRYLPAMIAVFLNASTADGYNPYRISRDGIDWEVFDPEDPWSNIGYWGDHQVVYLWRLLDLFHRHDPGALDRWLDRRLFSFADVPYRIKPFDAIVSNPYESIVFDDAQAEAAAQRVAEVGADGRLVHRDGHPFLVTLAEKLLVTVLTKLSNYVPDGGIWMNTQRPEWNDANNALAGWGMSVVTLAYLRRMIVFLLDLFPDEDDRAAELDGGVAAFLEDVAAVFAHHRDAQGPLSPAERYSVMEALGRAGSAYRAAVYAGGAAGAVHTVSYRSIRAVLRAACGELDATIATNRREDGLIHSYNILHLAGESATVGRLPEMLEGQVALMTSGVLDAADAERLLEGLRSGALYRPDAGSFTLYPDRRLPAFLEKNRVPAEALEACPWLAAEATRDDGRVVRRDARGVVRFNAAYRNARDLAEALESIAGTDADGAPSAEARRAVLDTYEAVFAHRAFTGRSGSFFKYEGLGSIYWHMVSKLNLAVLEAVRDGGDDLAPWYHRIREGIGVHKTPAEYGAFPFDPYSHTPAFVGAQQPGMTGQVKEDIIARFGELGVEVTNGIVRFRPRLLSPAEFGVEAGEFRYLDLAGVWRAVVVPPRALAFTYCQVPVVYHLTSDSSLSVTRRDGTTTMNTSPELDAADSRALFDRTGDLDRIDVALSERMLTG